jgi:hypothetical protein
LISKIRGQIRRSLTHRGLIGTFFYLPVPLFRRLRNLDPRRRRQMARELELQRDFDRTYHVDTAGTTELDGLEIVGNHRDLGHRYRGTDPQLFRAAIGSLPIHHEDFVFIDFGSGKGKALFLAAEWPFKAIIGVEFAPALHRIAESNIQTYRNPAQRCRDLRSINMDASEYELPAEPAVLYFYNPFSEPLLRKILERVRRSLEQNPRELWACYYHPHAHRPLDESPLFEVVSVTKSHRIYRARPDRRAETVDTERSGVVRNSARPR